MAKSLKQSPRRTKSTPSPRAKRRTLGELNAWLNENYDQMIKSARTNCVRLTGKPTFGGNGRKRKSA
jgi:ribosome-binding protein aMBF1 (putative translation factor)